MFGNTSNKTTTVLYSALIWRIIGLILLSVPVIKKAQTGQF